VTTPAEQLIAKLKSDAFNAEVKSQSEETMRRREQRRKELVEKPIAADSRVVAWIDILGFSRQLQAARTEADFQAAYRKMLFVQEWFNKESANDDPESRAEVNEFLGRSVLALSDGLVVTAGLSGKALRAEAPYDLAMSLMWEIVVAQAACALKGIFLRGGISAGLFHFENDILLSPALVHAYKLESEQAVYPIIVITHETLTELRALPGVEAYSEDSKPDGYFVPLAPEGGNQREPHEKLFFLDYVRYIAEPGMYSFDSVTDRDIWLDKNRPRAERRRIFDESLQKSAVKALQEHGQQIITAYREASTEEVKKKYKWLAEYHNRTLANQSATYDRARIDLAQFKS